MRSRWAGGEWAAPSINENRRPKESPGPREGRPGLKSAQRGGAARAPRYGVARARDRRVSQPRRPFRLVFRGSVLRSHSHSHCETRSTARQRSGYGYSCYPPKQRWAPNPTCCTRVLRKSGQSMLLTECGSWIFSKERRGPPTLATSQRFSSTRTCYTDAISCQE